MATTDEDSSMQELYSRLDGQELLSVRRVGKR